MDARRLFASLAVSLAFGLASCSGDNDPGGEPPTTAPPEPADTRPTSPEGAKFPQSFVKKVEPICVQARRSIDDLAPIEDEVGLREATSVYEDTARKLRKLKPPQQNAAAYDRFVEVYRDAARTLNGIYGELQRGDSSALQRVSPVLDNVNTEGGDAAEDYGFTKCTTG